MPARYRAARHRCHVVGARHGGWNPIFHAIEIAARKIGRTKIAEIEMVPCKTPERRGFDEAVIINGKRPPRASALALDKLGHLSPAGSRAVVDVEQRDPYPHHHSL